MVLTILLKGLIIALIIFQFQNVNNYVFWKTVNFQHGETWSHLSQDSVIYVYNGKVFFSLCQQFIQQFQVLALGNSCYEICVTQHLLLGFQKAKIKDWMAFPRDVQDEGPGNNFQFKTIIKVKKNWLIVTNIW